MGWLRGLYDRLPAGAQPLAAVLYDTVHPSRSVERYRRNVVEDLAALVDTDDPVIVDGGAHVGRTVEQFRRHFASPVVHAFEPYPEHARELEAAFGDVEAVRIYQYALGPEDTDVDFTVYNETETSSVLPLVREYRLVADPGDDYEVRETITVSQRRIDSVLDGPVDVIKLDLQGYELAALRGCGSLLDGCTAVLLEVEFVEYYDGQPLFCEVDSFLRDRGMRLFDLYDCKREVDGQLGVADALYVDDDLPSAVDQDLPSAVDDTSRS